MSREIKFRAWHEDLEVMVYSDKRNKSTYDIDYEFVINEKGSLVCNWHEDTEDVCGNFIESSGTLDNLMQYTGLKDKNGKEIYEGDIVTYSVKGSKEINKTVMTFNKEHGAYLFGIYKGVKMPCGKKTRMNKYTRKSVNNVEVIGNIYENPELLEGEK